MATALERINKIASKESSEWRNEAKTRQGNKAWRRRSFQIAVRILREIRMQKPVNGMTQKKLAEDLGVSPQYINKVLKGQENLTLETISKIEDVLGITLVEILNPEKTITVQGASITESAKVCRNLSKPIGSEVASMKDTCWDEYELDYEPNGTYGY